MLHPVEDEVWVLDEWMRAHQVCSCVANTSDCSGELLFALLLALCRWHPRRQEDRLRLSHDKPRVHALGALGQTLRLPISFLGR